MAAATLAGVLLRAEVTASGAGGGRSARVQAELRVKWREEIKRRGPMVREQWLESGEGRAALGAKTCNELLKRIRRQHEEVCKTAAGAAMRDAWAVTGEPLEGLRFDELGRLVPPGWGFDRHGKLRREKQAAGRSAVAPGPGAVRFRLSRHGVSNGTEHEPGTEPGAKPIFLPRTRRWTPGIAVACEDFFDGMDWAEAATYTANSPSSSSGGVITRIREMKAKPIDGQW